MQSTTQPRRTVNDFTIEIINLYTEQQWSIKKIARELQLREASINKLLRETVGLRQRGQTQETKNLIYTLHKRGLSKGEIASQVNLDRSYVSRILHIDFGVTPLPPRIKPKYEDLGPILVQEYLNGMSSGEIAEKHNISTGTVLNYVRKHKKKVRTYVEAQSNQGIDFDYFNKLSPKKEEQLGILWGIGNIYENILEKTLFLTIDYRKEFLLTKLLNKWVSENTLTYSQNDSNSVYTRITNTNLCENLKNWGLREEYPSIINSNNKNFWHGFLSVRVTNTQRGLSFSTRRMSESFINEMLIFFESEGLSNSLYCIKNQSYFIRDKAEIIKTLRQIPTLIPAIEHWGLDSEWKKIIEEAKNNK